MTTTLATSRDPSDLLQALKDDLEVDALVYRMAGDAFSGLVLRGMAASISTQSEPGACIEARLASHIRAVNLRTRLIGLKYQLSYKSHEEAFALEKTRREV